MFIVFITSSTSSLRLRLFEVPEECECFSAPVPPILLALRDPSWFPPVAWWVEGALFRPLAERFFHISDACMAAVSFCLIS
mmetsp:Transcript_41966/g.104968  ORF Transcript_41966/g.104968 Transcript_41966/m.104968 type:complete len:81 (-) Transcript_41966:1024-1266(-)